MLRSIVLGIALMSMAGACVSSDKRGDPIDVVSIRYDPYSYSMAKLQESALAQCRAKGARYAEPVGNDINPQSPRWAYMNFECF